MDHSTIRVLKKSRRIEAAKLRTEIIHWEGRKRPETAAFPATAIVRAILVTLAAPRVRSQL
jgi:hypothetical protein